MPVITINTFQGANLAFDELLLPEGVGVQSLNQRPGFGDLRPWNAPGGASATVPSSPQRLTIWRMGQDVASESNYWLSWSARVNVTLGFDTDDTTERTYERTYFSGDGTPKWTDNVKALSGGAPYPQATRELGVPTPATGLTAAISVDGTGTAVATSYRYTYVNDLGWESAPSPVGNTLLVKPGATVELLGFSAPPTGSYGITIVRLYKLVVGTSGSAEYFFLREWAVGSTPSNPIDDARSVGAAVLETEGWRVAPADGSGLKKLWNGMLAMGTGTSLRVCVPYRPYAYPLANEIALGAKFVALAVIGQRALVLTTGDARMVSGSTVPLDDDPAGINRPCASAASVVEFNDGFASKGAAWASEDGLCWWGESTGFVLLTEKLLTREQWQALNPDTMVAARYGRFYVCFYNEGALRGFVIDPQNPQGIYFLTTGYDAVYRDPVGDALYVLDGANVRRWDAGAAMSATFKSKLVQLPAPMNVGAIEVIAKAWPVTVSMWASGVLRFSKTFTKPDVIGRPSGTWQADELQFEVSSAARVISVRAAQTVEELLQP
jgi:hypothetical protein